MRVSDGYLQRVARDWQKAFAKAHDKPAPDVRYKNGWFMIGDGCRRYRRAALEDMTKTLRKGFKD